MDEFKLNAFLEFTGLKVVSLFIVLTFSMAAAASEREFNFFIYVNATYADIEKAQMAQIEELANLEKNPNANYFVTIKASNGNSTRFLLNENGISNKERLAPTDFADWREVSRFVSWAESIGKAKKNILIFNSHGNFYKSTDSGIINEDATTQQSISIHEYLFSLEYVKRILGRPLDLIVMDACTMSSIETHVQTHGYADFFVASSKQMSEVGINYSKIAKIINADFNKNEITSKALTIKIQDFLVAERKPRASEIDSEAITDPFEYPLSAFQLDRLPKFIKTMETFINQFLSSNKSIKNRAKKYLADNHEFCKKSYAYRETDGKKVSSIIYLGRIIQCLDPKNYSAQKSLGKAYSELFTELLNYTEYRQLKTSLNPLSSPTKHINDGLTVIFDEAMFQDPTYLASYKRLRFSYFSNWHLLGQFLTSNSSKL